MDNTFQFELVSPQEIVKSQATEMVVVPGVEGDLGVLPNHSPLITILRPGILNIHEGGKIKERIFISGGVCEIIPEHCIVLSEEILPEDKINTTKAKSRIAKAKSLLEETIAHAENFREVKEAQNNLAIAKELLAAAVIIEM